MLVDEDGMFLQGHADCLGVNLLYRTRISFYRAGVQFGIAVMRMAEPEDGPKGGLRQHVRPDLSRPVPAELPARARR